MRRAVILLLALALSGCWLQPGYGPNHQNFDPFETGLTANNVASLRQVWAADVPNTLSFDPLVNGTAVVSAGAEFLPGGAGPAFVVTALGRGSGALLWKRDFLPGPSAPASALGRVLRADADEVLIDMPFAAAGPEVVALDADTGATLRTLPAPGLGDPDAVVVDDHVVAYAAVLNPAGPDPQADIRVFDRATFSPLWSSAPAHDFDALATPTLISQGRLFARGLAGGRPTISAFDLAGCGAAVCDPLFTVPIPQPANPSQQADQLAATDDGHVLVRLRTSAPDARLIDLTADGAQAWVTTLPDVSGVAVAGDTIYATDAVSRVLFALDAATGAVRWQASVADLTGTPIAAGGLVYVAARASAVPSRVESFAAGGCGQATCAPVASIPMGTPTAMSISEGTLFTESHSDLAVDVGQITVFAPTT